MKRTLTKSLPHAFVGSAMLLAASAAFPSARPAVGLVASARGTPVGDPSAAINSPAAIIGPCPVSSTPNSVGAITVDQAPASSSEQTAAAVHSAISAGFSPLLSISPGDRDGSLRYFVGDFNADGVQDVAVAVSSDGNPDLKLAPGVKVVSPRSRTQSAIDLKQHIEAVAIIHGGPAGWQASASLPRFLVLWVGYPSKLASKRGAARLKYPLPAQAKGDALFCVGDGSGDGYLYFDGTGYRFKLMTRGD